MRFKEEFKQEFNSFPYFSWTYQQGLLWDFWMFPHFLAGVVLASVLRLLSVSFVWSAVITFTLLVLWEVFEKVAYIYEPWMNTFMDLVMGVLGFWLVYGLEAQWGTVPTVWDTVLVVFLWLALNTLGWRAWRKRKKKEIQTRES